MPVFCLKAFLVPFVLQDGKTRGLIRVGTASVAPWLEPPSDLQLSYLFVWKHHKVQILFSLRSDFCWKSGVSVHLLPRCCLRQRDQAICEAFPVDT